MATKNITNLLKAKNVIYIKADKGNSLVILDKLDYDKRVTDMIAEGPYEEVKYRNGNTKNPLPSMIKSAKEVANLLEKTLEIPHLHYRLNMQNPRVPYLYALPKIHKPGNKMRPIVSNISTPTEKLSKWLINEFNKMNEPTGMYVKNSIEFVNKIRNMVIKDDEVMVSFDVTALYPNVPVDIAIQCMVEHAQQENIDDKIISMYKKVAEICMNQNFFQFRGKMYKQTFGTCMGSKIAPYLSNIFMYRLERTMSTSQLFPRIWLRYVDDVFAVLKKTEINKTLEMLNDQYPTIKFTYEVEKDGILPFLDIKVIRNNNNVEFGIYRKPTNTMRFITADSHHNGSQKKAAFHALAHRLYNVPMTTVEFQKEENFIKDAALINGYRNKFINSILHKHKRKKVTQMHTNLLSISEPASTKRICFPFFPAITNKMGNLLKKFNIELVTRSTNLAESLCRYKDVPPSSSKSGIYKISCSNCDQIYVGQTTRPFNKRLQEHTLAVKNKDIHKSSVADHMVNNNNHKIDTVNSKIIRTINEKYKLDAYESILMDKHKNLLMNNEASPIFSNLFNIINS